MMCRSSWPTGGRSPGAAHAATHTASAACTARATSAARAARTTSAARPARAGAAGRAGPAIALPDGGRCRRLHPCRSVASAAQPASMSAGQWEGRGEQWEGRGDSLGDAWRMCLKRETIAKYGNFACLTYEILHMNVHCLYAFYVCLYTLCNILGCLTL